MKIDLIGFLGTSCILLLSPYRLYFCSTWIIPQPKEDNSQNPHYSFHHLRHPNFENNGFVTTTGQVTLNFY
jgi:hypothetical protein